MYPQPPQPVRFRPFKDLLHYHPKAMYMFVITGLALIASFGTFVMFYKKPVPVALPAVVKPQIPPALPKPVVYYSPLTGAKVDSEAATQLPLTAVMIENSPDARPQSGLFDAGIIYEAIAEGGITRFLALYQEAKPQLIGPVRSVRMYYVDWVAPYNASVAHVGGSYNALQELRNGNYRDIDQFFNAPTYWRARDRYAPHNVYTSFERLDALNDAKGYKSSNFTSFARTDGKPAAQPNASSVVINFSAPLYNTNYTYDAASNRYMRSMAGVPHQDREKGQLAPNSVIAMFVNMTRVMEDGYRESIETSGSGRAVIFQNGTATEATWQKPGREAQVKFVDAGGVEVPLNRGQTWIAAVPTNGGGGASWQ